MKDRNQSPTYDTCIRKFIKFRLKKDKLWWEDILHIIFCFFLHFLCEIGYKIIIFSSFSWILYEIYSRYPIIISKVVCSKGSVLGSYISNIEKSGEISKLVRMTFTIWFNNTLVLYISHHIHQLDQYLQNNWISASGYLWGHSHSGIESGSLLIHMDLFHPIAWEPEDKQRAEKVL